MSMTPAVMRPRSNQSLPFFVVVQGTGPGNRVLLEHFPFMIGRGAHCDLQLRDGQVSRVHCVIKSEQGTLLVQDLGSRNGTVVNSRRVLQSIELSSGDLLMIGQTILQLEHSSRSACEQPTHSAGETLA